MELENCLSAFGDIQALGRIPGHCSQHRVLVHWRTDIHRSWRRTRDAAPPWRSIVASAYQVDYFVTQMTSVEGHFITAALTHPGTDVATAPTFAVVSDVGVSVRTGTWSSTHGLTRTLWSGTPVEICVYRSWSRIMDQLSRRFRARRAASGNVPQQSGHRYFRGLLGVRQLGHGV